MRISAAFTSALLLAGFVGLAVSAAPAQQLTPLYDFCAQSGCTDGAVPQGYLIQGSDGNFYGVTSQGGTGKQGTVFKITTTGTLTTLYGFCSVGEYCTDGAQPYSGVIEGSDGNLYGTTVAGGVIGGDISESYDLCGGATGVGSPPAYTCGTAFKLNPTTGQLTTLYTFCSQLVTINGSPFCGDGANPTGGLVEDGEGNFYGTTAGGGTTGQVTGIVYKLSPEPTGGCPAGSNPGNGYCETVLSSFCAQNGCGWGPVAGLTQGSDGNFYGTTYGGLGVPGNDGTVFEMTPSGTVTTLYYFCDSHPTCTDGAGPTAKLVQGSDGNFYGTTTLYGNIDALDGAVFKLSPEPPSGCPAGTNPGYGWCETTLHTFCSSADCPDGRIPYFGLIQGSDGNLYGMTYVGGAGQCIPFGDAGCGTIFSITPTGTLTTLHDFCTVGTFPDCADGALPFAALVQGKDYNFYGLASMGGPPLADNIGNLGEGIFFVLAVLPIASVSPSSLTFTSQDEGTTSQSQPVTLSNTGQEALTVSNVAATGDFSETDNCVGSVAVGNNCTINVFFKPTQTGTRTGTLTITDNNAGITGSQQMVSLTGTGANPGAKFSATALAFGNEGIQTTSSGKKVTLTSSGTTSLNNISVAVIGPNQADFLPTSTCPATLNVGAKCTITVTFTPSLLAKESATLQLTDNTVNSPQSVALSGTGVADVTLTPTSENFGSVAQATSSAAKTFTLKNNQSTALSISEITFTGTNQGDFSQTGGTCGTSLAAKASCTIQVTFTPSLLGAESATLSVTSNAQPPYNSLTSTLSGTGIAQSTVSPTSVTYSKQKVGTTSGARDVKLKNNLSSAITISGFSFTGADQGDFNVSTTTCGASLAPKSTCTVSLVFKPTATGQRTATLNVDDGANDSPQTVSLTGTGD